MTGTAGPEPTGEAGVGDRLNRLKEGVGSYAREKAGAVRQQASTLVDDQKRAAADNLTDVSEALRQASSHLVGHSQTMIAGVAQTAADQLDTLARNVREHEVADLIEETRGLAVRQPGLFFLGALAVGFLFVRIARAGTLSTPSGTGEPAGEIPLGP